MSCNYACPDPQVLYRNCFPRATLDNFRSQTINRSDAYKVIFSPEFTDFNFRYRREGNLLYLKVPFSFFAYDGANDVWFYDSILGSDRYFSANEYLYLYLFLTNRQNKVVLLDVFDTIFQFSDLIPVKVRNIDSSETFVLGKHDFEFFDFFISMMINEIINFSYEFNPYKLYYFTLREYIPGKSFGNPSLLRKGDSCCSFLEVVYHVNDFVRRLLRMPVGLYEVSSPCCWFSDFCRREGLDFSEIEEFYISLYKYLFNLLVFYSLDVDIREKFFSFNAEGEISVSGDFFDNGKLLFLKAQPSGVVFVSKYVYDMLKNKDYQTDSSKIYFCYDVSSNSYLFFSPVSRDVNITFYFLNQKNFSWRYIDKKFLGLNVPFCVGTNSDTFSDFNRKNGILFFLHYNVSSVILLFLLSHMVNSYDDLYHSNNTYKSYGFCPSFDLQSVLKYVLYSLIKYPLFYLRAFAALLSNQVSQNFVDIFNFSFDYGSFLNLSAFFSDTWLLPGLKLGDIRYGENFLNFSGLFKYKDLIDSVFREMQDLRFIPSFTPIVDSSEQQYFIDFRDMFVDVWSLRDLQALKRSVREIVDEITE